jgi:hypothetical protein
VSRTGGWISPVVLLGGRAAGTWQIDTTRDAVAVELFERVPRDGLDAEVVRLASFLGRPMSANVRYRRRVST